MPDGSRQAAASNAFVKTGPVSALGMFEAEADGLKELRNAGAIRVPEVFEVGTRNGHSFIAMERFNLERASAGTEASMGRQLAALHRHTNDRFGWVRDNTIGLTPQINTRCDDWCYFYGEHRLEFQLQLAAANGYGDELAEPGKRLIERLPGFFESHKPVASLLHGDLWGGNWGSADGEPVIFDPAVYYGDRETDIAMTKLFGGFGKTFYAAYEDAWPLAGGHEARNTLYQLYHVLNHLNLFGSGYLGQALSLMQSLLDRELF